MIVKICFAQWEILNDGFKGNINTIDFVNENIGWIAGYNGTLLKTTDGGDNWNTIPIDESWTIYQIDFINDSVGWAVGFVNWDIATIWQTRNGGLFWSTQKSISEVNLSSIYALDENYVFVAGDNKIYKTSNGGLDWQDVSPARGMGNFKSIWFQDPDSGIVVREIYGVLRTTDGGKTWDPKLYNCSYISDLQFLNDGNGYFIANLGATYCFCKTDDMCLSWSVVLQTSDPITSFQFIDDKTVYAVISDSGAYNKIIGSNDGGVTWQNVQVINIDFLQLNKIYFNRSKTGFVIGNLGFGSFLLMSENVEENLEWKIKNFSHYINDVTFIDKFRGFLLGYSFTGGGTHVYSEGHIFSTSNCGKNWEINSHSYDIFQSSFFINVLEGFTLTSRGEIHRTLNSGLNWIQVYGFNPDSAGYFWGNDICFINDEIGFAVGNYAVSFFNDRIASILNTSDGGLTWNLEDQYGYYSSLNSIYFCDTTGWTVGESGIILKYIPRTGWIKQTSPTDLPLNKVFFSMIKMDG